MKIDRQLVGIPTGWTDVTKDVLYITMFMCSMFSPGLLNPDVSHMFSLILTKHRPQMSLVGLNLTRTALRHNIPKTKVSYPDVS